MQFAMKTTLIKSWTTLFPRNSERFILRNLSSDTYSKREEENKVEKDLDNYLTKSPLKNYEEYTKWLTSPYPEGALVKKAKEEVVEKINPKFTTVIIFPGQGSQFVGMGKDLLKYGAVNDMFEVASDILKFNLKEMCLKGPKNKLHKTKYCQPATVVCSLAALEKLKHEDPNVLERCVVTCGFSLGELTALIFAGVFTFEDGIRITKIRAEAMQACSEAVPSGMMTILCGSDSDVKGALNDAVLHCKKNGLDDAVCVVANYISAEVKVIAGHNEALQYIENSKEKYKIRKTARLLVSGAFHTQLMKDAVEPLEAVMNRVCIKSPVVTVLSNVSGKPYKNIKDIKKNFVKQVCMPVKWEQMLSDVYLRPVGMEYPVTYVCGPGLSIKTILNRLNSKAAQQCHVVF